MRNDPSMTIFGNLTKDPAEKEVNGKPITEYGVAVNTRDGDTIFVDVTSFGAKKGALEYLKKGSPVSVTGAYRFRTFTKKDGSAGYAHSLTQRDLVLLPSGKPREDAPVAPAADDATPF